MLGTQQRLLVQRHLVIIPESQPLSLYPHTLVKVKSIKVQQRDLFTVLPKMWIFSFFTIYSIPIQTLELIAHGRTLYRHFLSFTLEFIHSTKLNIACLQRFAFPMLKL